MIFPAISLRRQKPENRPQAKTTRGLTMVEVLVAILVLSLGLLGIAGLHAATLKYKINTWAHSALPALLSDLSERIRINPQAAGARFTNQGSSESAYKFERSWKSQQDVPPPVGWRNCGGTPAARADCDLFLWRQRVRNTLPQGSALITGDLKKGINLTLMWFDKERVDPSGDRKLLSPAICSDPPTDASLAQKSCCPAKAGSPADLKGVRCARFHFIP